MGFWENIDENYENKVPQDVKNICDGYAAGINYYLDQHPNLKIKEFPIINGRDLIAGFSHRMPLMFGFDGLIKELSKSNSEDVDTKAEDHLYDALRYGIMSRPRFSIFDYDPIGRPSMGMPVADSTFGY